MLEPGDALLFDIPSWNYTVHAANFGLPLNPTSVSFVFSSAVSNIGATFEAGLQSSDGAFSVSLGAPLSFGPGTFWSSTFSGAVSTLEGSFELTAQASEEIFGGAGAELILRDLGPAVELGLPPSTLRQDLFVSLSGGPLEVGGLPGAVLVQNPEVAEPHSSALLIVGGLLLCLASRLGRKMSHQPFAIRLGTLILSRWQIGTLPLAPQIQRNGVE